MPVQNGQGTRFKQEFKAFLAEVGFQLKHFLPDDYFQDKMFPDCLIPRATGYDKLRGQGKLTEELALLWARRADCFLAEGLKNARTNGKELSLEGIRFIDHDNGQPKVNWRKLISLYDEDRLVPICIKINDSIDDAQVAAMLSVIRSVVGAIQIVVARVREGCTENTILVSRERADQILAWFAQSKELGSVTAVEVATLPPEGSLARRLFLEGPPIDIGRPDAADRFEEAWRRAVHIESVVRPWRRLRWLFSPKIRSAPIARVIGDSDHRAYAADHRGIHGSLRADVFMTCMTWPAAAAILLALCLLALHPFFPYIAMGGGIATGIALSLAGVQVCASALSPIACGAGTIAICWAFGLAHAFAIGALRGGLALSRLNIRHDLFVSVTGGVVGLAAPQWLSRLQLPVVVLLLWAIASAITVTGWCMVQPARAAGVRETSLGRMLLGAAAGSAMGAGIVLTRALSIVFKRLGCPAPSAFVAAFALVGGAAFALAIRVRIPRIPGAKWLLFVLGYELITCALCGVAYQSAGTLLGLLALVASTGWFQSTWFTAASVVGLRIGSTRAAVIATTVEGALGFTAFVVLRMH